MVNYRNNIFFGCASSLLKFTVQDSMDMSKRKDAGQVTRIKEMASELGLEIKYTSKHILNEFADQRPHQGMLLDCDPLDWLNMDVLPTAAEAMEAVGDGPPPIWLCMDQVFDPVRPVISFSKSNRTFFFSNKYRNLNRIFFGYRSVGNTWACYVTLRLHMPTDYAVTPIIFGSLRYARTSNAHVKLKKKSRYVTQRRHMPTSINQNRYVTQEAIMHVFLDAISAADLTPRASFFFFICFISVSVQLLRGFMNLNREQLDLAATFWWPAFGKGTAVAAKDSISFK